MHRKRMKYLSAFIQLKLFLLLHMQPHAQTPFARAYANQNHVWLIWNGTVKFNNKYSVFYDFQSRRAELVETAQQWVARAGLLYNTSESVNFGAGYAYVETYRYGDFPVQNNFTEHRAWQQLQLKQKFAKSTLFHRYRLEQRWIGDSNFGAFQNPRYENRIRYMMRYNIPLFKVKEKQVYTNLWDEVMLNFGWQVGRNLFDQNRVSAQLGISITPKVNIELGYMNQLLQQRGATSDGKNKMENNNTATLTVTGNF
ncbi:MAG: DUF2490 domain-containing protein [Flavobacteriales bacterium]